MSLSLYDLLSEKLPHLALKREEPLSQHTSFRIGGPAEVMAFPRTQEELTALLRAALRPISGVYRLHPNGYLEEAAL